HGLDHRQRGIGLADACGIEPRKEALRARRRRLTVALGPPIALLFAAARAPSENERGERGGNACQRPVGLEHQSRLGGVVRGQGITGSFSEHKRASSPRRVPSRRGAFSFVWLYR